MTDDLPGGAEAPAEAPAIDEGVSAPDVALEPTPRGALDRAFASLDEQAEPEKPTEGRARNPDGTFAATEKPAETEKTPEATTTPETTQTPATDVPTRFSADAKAEWDKVPPAVKGEVNRAFRELETGIQQYRQQVEPLKDWIDLAAKNNTSLPQALERYAGFEVALRKNTVAGLQSIAKDMGFDLAAVAKQIAGQPAAPQDQVVAELRNKIAGLEQQLGGVTSTLTEQHNTALRSHITSFADSKPDFDALAPLIVQNIDRQLARSNPGQALDAAYTKAKEQAVAIAQASGLIPPPAPVPQPPTTDTAAQTRKGGLSVTGAPGSGSNPVSRTVPSSPRAALDTAFAQLGIG
jgi:hypothetical protein